VHSSSSTVATPTISVALCTFNGERFLRDQLDSILKQTLLPYEVVACDDGSTDSTLDILSDFAQRARFPVRIIRNEQRLGVRANFARANSECRGDYVAPCDQDDVWLPERLETFTSFVKQRPCALVFSDAYLIDDSGRKLGRTTWQSFGLRQRELRYFSSGRALECLVERTLVTGATMIVRRDFLSVGFPIPPNLPKPLHQDAWLVLVAVARNEIGVVPKPLMFYRQHAAQQGGVPVRKSFWQRVSSWFGLDKEERKARIARHREYLDAAVARGELLEELLSGRVGQHEAWGRTWTAALNHLRWRQHLPANLFRRFCRVLHAAALGTYLRYSGDAGTDIARDTLYGGRSTKRI
jgi:glycosyltransferase involved in cell wall biosynthesis